MGPISFQLSEDLDSEDARAISEGLMAYNYSKSGRAERKNLAIVAKDENGKVIGGIRANTLRSWLYVDQLWVAEAERKSGLGSKLMEMAESEARKRGCIGSHLNTYSFQALDFYKKLGYEMFGQLNDFPPGHINYFLTKKLQS